MCPLQLLQHDMMGVLAYIPFWCSGMHSLFKSNHPNMSAPGMNMRAPSKAKPASLGQCILLVHVFSAPPSHALRNRSTDCVHGRMHVIAGHFRFHSPTLPRRPHQASHRAWHGGRGADPKAAGKCQGGDQQVGFGADPKAAGKCQGRG